MLDTENNKREPALKWQLLNLFTATVANLPLSTQLWCCSRTDAASLNANFIIIFFGGGGGGGSTFSHSYINMKNAILLSTSLVIHIRLRVNTLNLTMASFYRQS